MKIIPRIATVCVLTAMVFPSPVRGAEPPADIAELFPKDTLAYVELTNPGEFAPQLAAMFKGSALEDSIASIHERKDAAKTLFDLNGKRELALLGLLTSPEMRDELKKLRGAAALTGFSEQGEPEFVLVVLTHDSPAAGLAARAFLTMSQNLRKVGEVSKVPVFQNRTPNLNYDNNGVPNIDQKEPFTDSPTELTFAYTPGLFLMGSSKTAIGNVLQRFLGEKKEAGLSTVKWFQDAAAAHRKTGVFYAVNFPEFVTKFEEANKNRGAIRGITELFGVKSDLDLYAWFNLTANAKAVKSLAGGIRFRDGGLSATTSIGFDPAQKSPLLDFLSGSGVKVQLLHHVRRPAVFAFSVTLPKKNRAAALIGFLDAVAKANGELGRLPSDAVGEWEEKFKVAMTDTLLGKLESITILMPTTQKLPDGAKAMPMAILHLEDTATATAWVEFMPNMIGDMSGAKEPPQPGTETIEGVKVYSLPGAGLRWNGAVHYARSGTAVAIGLDRERVAQAVTPNAAESVVGGTFAISPPSGDTGALGVVSLGGFVVQLTKKPKEGPGAGEDLPRFLPNGNPLPVDFEEGLKKVRKAFTEAAMNMQPATVTARRVGDELQIEIFQPKAQTGGLKDVINAGIDWFDKIAPLRMQQTYDRFGRIHTGLW